MVRKALVGTALACGLTLLASTSGFASVTVVTVSKEPSPLASCANDSQTGKNFVSGEEEPQLAVSGKTMIAMFHQDRWSNGGAHGIGVGTSSNGGKTWAQSTFPDDQCVDGTPASLSFYQRSSDPWVSFGRDGTAYASALSFNNTNNFNAVVAASSTDGGVTWSNMQPIPGSVFTTFQNSTDKNSTTADPTIAGTAYTVWDTLTLPTDQPDDNPHTQSYTGPAFFSRTVDGGQTWSPAQIIVNTAQRQQTIGNIIVVDARPGVHTLYDFTDLITSPNTPFRGTRSDAEIAFVKSTDGGTTWTQPLVIEPFNSVGVIDPNTGQPLRVGDGLEEVAIDRSTGKLYLAWESSTNFNKSLNQSSAAFDNEILLISSSDGGASWTAPVQVDHNNNGLPAYTPTVAVNNGRVAVTYYDNRFLQPGQTNVLPTDYWVSTSSDGGATFGNEQRITSTSFDQLSAPVARGFFLGDYEALQPSGGGFEAVFVKTNCDAPYTGPDCGPANFTGRVPQTSNTNPTDVFAAAIS